MSSTIQLSALFASNCGAYTFAVTFGQALKALRGDRTGPEIAARALGLDAPPGKLRDFANYLSKLENDRVPNVGLGRLRRLATGHGFPSLAIFFERIEAIQAGVAHAQKGTQHAPSPPAIVPPSSGSHHHVEDRPVSADRVALDELRVFIARLGDVLNDVAAKTFPEDPEEPRSLPSPRPRKPKGG